MGSPDNPQGPREVITDADRVAEVGRIVELSKKVAIPWGGGTKDVADYYGILGLDPSANASEVKKALRKVTRLVHPDVFREERLKQKAQEAIILVNDAKSVLDNPNDKQTYDNTLNFIANGILDFHNKIKEGKNYYQLLELNYTDKQLPRNTQVLFDYCRQEKPFEFVFFMKFFHNAGLSNYQVTNVVKQLKKAVDTLSDPQKKQQYDSQHGVRGGFNALFGNLFGGVGLDSFFSNVGTQWPAEETLMDMWRRTAPGTQQTPPQKKGKEKKKDNQEKSGYEQLLGLSYDFDGFIEIIESKRLFNKPEAINGLSLEEVANRCKAVWELRREAADEINSALNSQSIPKEYGIRRMLVKIIKEVRDLDTEIFNAKSEMELIRLAMTLTLKDKDEKLKNLSTLVKEAFESKDPEPLKNIHFDAYQAVKRILKEKEQKEQKKAQTVAEADEAQKQREKQLLDQIRKETAALGESIKGVDSFQNLVVLISGFSGSELVFGEERIKKNELLQKLQTCWRFRYNPVTEIKQELQRIPEVVGLREKMKQLMVEGRKEVDKPIEVLEDFSQNNVLFIVAALKILSEQGVKFVKRSSKNDQVVVVDLSQLAQHVEEVWENRQNKDTTLAGLQRFVTSGYDLRYRIYHKIKASMRNSKSDPDYEIESIERDQDYQSYLKKLPKT